MKESKVSFSHFLDKFPEIALPVTLGDEAHHDFSRENDPLPGQMTDQYLEPLEEEPADELTEYIACFRLPETHGFHALVYWRAGLMSYRYRLVTFTTKGEVINHRVIAGTYSDGEVLTKAVATIDEDWEIVVVSGQLNPGTGAHYEASASNAHKMELLPDGTITDI